MILIEMEAEALRINNLSLKSEMRQEEKKLPERAHSYHPFLYII